MAVARALRTWRIGISNTYDIEQLSMALPLWRAVRRSFDILHLQDPLLARVLDAANRMGLSRPRVILANGTGLTPDALAGFSVVQELTPTTPAPHETESDPRRPRFVIPNFIDTDAYSPTGRERARAKLGLPADAFVVLTVAAIRRFHKRIDHLIREFADARRSLPNNSVLLIAGGRENDTDEIIRLGSDLLGPRVRFLPAQPREEMPDIYRAADQFVLTSLFETFGIVLLEAMASGLPVLCHDTPAFRYVSGPAGRFCDMSAAGSLAQSLIELSTPETREAFARNARQHVIEHFSEPVVVERIVEMYGRVIGGPS